MKTLVIGSGPAGLIAASTAANKNNQVIVLEKNEKAGKKLFITGKGRCNVTNNCNEREFIANVVSNPKFLFSAINKFSSKDTIDWFESKGCPLVIERGNRVFPKSYRAGDIANALFGACKNNGVKFAFGESVIDVFKQEKQFVVKTKNNTYSADKIVIATGGKSYSYTGSTGDGYKFASRMGHTIVDPKPGLVTLKVKESIPSSLYKFTLKNVSLNVALGNKKYQEFGEVTFYKEGIAGATALTLSSLINRTNPNEISLSLDFKPALTNEKLDQRIIREIQSKENQTLEHVVRKLLPKEMVDWFFGLTRINKNRLTSEVKKEERESLVRNLKSFKFNFVGLDDIDRAVITSGGISTKEINPKTMESKLVPGLYFIGEVIDVDAFTGGFNMQIAFSTGALAAESIKNA